MILYTLHRVSVVSFCSNIQKETCFHKKQVSLFNTVPENKHFRNDDTIAEIRQLLP